METKLMHLKLPFFRDNVTILEHQIQFEKLDFALILEVKKWI